MLRQCGGACRRTFTTINHPGHHTTTTLAQVESLATRGHLDEALTLFYTLQPPPSPLHSNQTYATLFHACTRHHALHQGLSLHHRYTLSHNNRNQTSLFVSNHVINMYAKLGYLDKARHVFDEMPSRNLVTWTALISGYAQHCFADECFRLFATMLTHHLPNEFAIASVLSAADSVVRGQQVHALALKMSLDGCPYVANALITMYCKGCGPSDDAWEVFTTMESRNLVSWNSMIAGFQRCGLGARAVQLFERMHAAGIEFDRATLLGVFCSLDGVNSVIDEMEVVRFCYQLHCLVVKTGFITGIQVVTALVKAYSDLGGDAAECYRLFTETTCRRDIVAWTGIMTIYSERDPEEVISLYCQLGRENLTPDRYTFSIVLKAYASLATERHASAVHSQVIKAGFWGDTVLANALIHAYARCGSISLSKQVFDGIEVRDIVSWNTMLKAYALYGQAAEALQLFSQMDIRPYSATFVSLLCACSHAGLVEEGIRIFDSMLERHGIAPLCDHYACMVDILGRAGRVGEAEKLVSRMPMEPDSVVWSALLGSCRKHGHTELAALAADKLKKLAPERSLGYVQLSNIYSSDGNFGEAGLIRKEMKNSRVKKEPGLSWIEIRNQVHEFSSGGRRHPEGNLIRRKLKDLIVRLREIGYVPDTSSSVHDVEEEHKEEQLYYHSEKLALVCAIMNESSLRCGKTAIKIMKNIRVCADCHNFMKLASNLLQKDIVLRDSNRFHHFKDGICSCHDYW